MTRMLGVDHVVAYVNKVTSRAAILMEHYVISGYLTVLPWLAPPDKVHYFGQIAALQDCMIRLRHVAR